MSDRHDSLETSNCIICGKLAESWTGHVHLGRADLVTVIAGWCLEHSDEHQNEPVEDCCYRGCGCFGMWKPGDGIFVVSRSDGRHIAATGSSPNWYSERAKKSIEA